VALSSPASLRGGDWPRDTVPAQGYYWRTPPSTRAST
jgi:hypothetical protein